VARTWLLALGLATVALTVGCNNEDRIVSVNNSPYRVDGVYSVTGDQEVSVYWRENQESDIDHYKVYRNNAPTGTFALRGTASSPPFVDTQVTNGTTYYYAVSAVDHSGQESAELSFENAFDTPRPEGFGVTLTNANTTPATSGWDFSAMTRRPSTDPLTDVYFDAASGFLIYAVNGVKIQDAGYIPLVDVDFAPDDTGWSSDGIVEAIPGHSYIVLTPEGHYAKFEVVSRATANIVMDWAYQVDPDNRELAPKLARKP
jgi:hypothetical protein